LFIEGSPLLYLFYFPKGLKAYTASSYAFFDKTFSIINGNQLKSISSGCFFKSFQNDWKTSNHFLYYKALTSNINTTFSALPFLHLWRSLDFLKKVLLGERTWLHNHKSTKPQSYQHKLFIMTKWVKIKL